MHWILLFVAPVAGDIFYVTVTTTLTQFIPWAANMSTESDGVFYPSHSLDSKVPSSTWTPHEGDTSTKEPDGLDGVETMWRPSARAAPSVISETFVTTDSGTNCGEAHGPLYPDNGASMTYVRTSGESEGEEIEDVDDVEEGIGDGQIKRVGKEISVGEVTEVGEVSRAHVIWSQITEISPIVIAGTGLEMATECVTSGNMNSCTDLSDATMTETADVTKSAALSLDDLLTTPTDRVDIKMENLKQPPSHLSIARYFSLEIVPHFYPFPSESTSLSSSSKVNQNQIHLTTTNSKPFLILNTLESLKSYKPPKSSQFHKFLQSLESLKLLKSPSPSIIFLSMLHGSPTPTNPTSLSM
ncbi:CIC11C00000002375 [Sungouiella intermedia]|uniref:CIC11C00000002375 n=1 Tax=Sungouiella intermedia TaxID=45354 RepID=A0A1L0BYN5_9ASCO|nr:CIC11C00000002375 [[Candida] intermedia]